MFAEFVRQSAVAPGSATTINLVAPTTGYRSFVSAFPGAMVCGYYIRDRATNAWERGTGVATAGSPDTLTRTTVLSNSLGTTARINFTGTVEVYSQLFPPSSVGAALMLATSQAAARDAISARATLGTSVATTSGSAIAFTGLPAGINWLDLHLASFSTNGVQVPFVRLGTGGGPTYAATGYAATATSLADGAPVSCLANATAFTFSPAWTAAIVVSGRMSFRRLGGNIWTVDGSLSRQDVNGVVQQSGSVTLPAELTAIQLTTADAFDAGTANASWGF